MENLAWSGHTWVNDARHAWAGWHYGRAGLAVDGASDTALSHCAVVDNLSVDQPVWMVDLGARRRVRGLMVLTWQGQGQGEWTFEERGESGGLRWWSPGRDGGRDVRAWRANSLHSVNSITVRYHKEARPVHHVRARALQRSTHAG